MNTDIDSKSNARTRWWYGDILPRPELVVLIRWVGSLSILKEGESDIFNVDRDVVA
jgi:hypothetical protein